MYLHAPRRHTENELQAALQKLMAPRTRTAAPVVAPRVNVWHAAVVGVSARHAEQLDKLRQEETDSQSKLAFDYAYTTAFGESGKIKSAAKYVFDYGTFNEFGQLLETFFAKNEEESIPNQVKAAHHLDAAAIQKQKETFQQQPLFKKWLQIISGKRWSIQQYASKL